MLPDLTAAIFDADAGENVNTFRQNLQLEYVNRLAAMVGSDAKAQFDYVSQSAALHNLRQIERVLSSNPGVDKETRAHRANVVYTIKRSLDAES